MGKELAVRAWAYGEDVVLESYRYAPGPAGGGEKHSHEGYQFCLSLDFPGEYRYRGERHPVPVGSLSVIHPGEVHSSREPHDRKTTANFRVMYLSSGMLANAASEVAGRNFGLPFFCEPILLERAALPDNVRRFHAALSGPKTLVWMEGEHTEFYDSEPLVTHAARGGGAPEDRAG